MEFASSDIYNPWLLATGSPFLYYVISLSLKKNAGKRCGSSDCVDSLYAAYIP